jgi:hypothetical protein
MVTTRRTVPRTPGTTYHDCMDRVSSDTSRPSLAERLQAAGIPVPPPMSDAERADWERAQAEADAQPRIYGPKRTAA